MKPKETAGACPVCGAVLGGEGVCVACVLSGCLEGAGKSVLETCGEDLGEIGSHRILARVGRGGMGIVFKARHEALGRVVAIKVLAGGRWADVEAVERFRAEAAAVSRLRHPGIVAVHEVGCHEGQHWYSMDYVEGASLAELAEGAVLDPRTAVEWVREIAAAIQYAHQRGVVHRDIKPSNILLDADGHPRVTDFGLMRDMGVESGMTETGQVMGTPGYVPPEQVQGSAGGSGPAADVYGLGATLYHLLTGKPPFSGPHLSAVLRQVVQEEPVAPSRLQPRVNQDLETICLKCLEKDPARRYGSAGALEEDLGRWLRHEPIWARPGTVLDRALKWGRRHRALAAAYVISGLLLGILVSLLIWDDARLRQSQGETRMRMVEGWVEQANALKLSGQSGSREQALKLLRETSKLELGEALKARRDEVLVSVLALPDIVTRMPEELPVVHDFMHVVFDAEMRRCVVPTDQGRFGLLTLGEGGGTRMIPLKLNEADQVLGFSPDGRYVSFRRGDGVMVWDGETGEFVLGSEGGGGGLAFDRKGRRCWRGERSSVVGCYDLPSGVRRGELVLGDVGVLRCVLWVEEEGALVVGSESGWVEKWVEGEGQARWRRNLEETVVAGGASGVRGEVVMLTLGDRMVTLDLETGRTVRGRVTPVNQSASVVYSPDGTLVAVGHEYDGVRLLDASTGNEIMHHSARTWGLVFGSDGRRMGPVWERGRVGWLEYDPSPIVKHLVPEGSPSRAVGVVFGRGGRMLAAASGSGIDIWDVESGRVVQAVRVSGVQCMDWSGVGRGFVVGTKAGLWHWDESVRGPDVLEVGEGRLLTRENVLGLRFSPCGRWLAVAEIVYGRVRIFRTSDWGEVAEMGGMRNVEWCGFDGSGEVLVVGSEDPPGMWQGKWREGGGGLVRVEDAGLDGGSYQRLFSGVGAGSVDFGSTLRIWEGLGGGRRVEHGLKSNNVQFAAAISPDGRILAATQRDVVIQLVGMLDGKSVRVLDGGGVGRIRSLSFDPTGRRLGAVRERGEVQLWDLEKVEREVKGL